MTNYYMNSYYVKVREITPKTTNYAVIYNDSFCASFRNEQSAINFADYMNKMGITCKEDWDSMIPWKVKRDFIIASSSEYPILPFKFEVSNNG